MALVISKYTLFRHVMQLQDSYDIVCMVLFTNYRSVDQIGTIFTRAMRVLGDDAYVGQHNSRLVDVFYADSPEPDKARVLTTFTETDSVIRLLICSIAFGLGVNISNIRNVIIWGIPDTPLTLWQEIGRAGRDGKPSTAHLCKLSTSHQKMKAILDCGDCIRLGILNCLMLPQFDTTPLKAIKNKKKCNERNCADTCSCQYCLCCSVCQEKCQCPKKYKPQSL